MNALDKPMDIQSHPSRWNAYLIFLLAASFYLYEFILQVAPSVMADDMMNAFHINAAGFGIISAFYFYSYAPMQLPAGVLFDRYGPRKLMTIALIICGIGSIFFAATDSLVTAALGRFLIGVASAFSFIGVLILVSRWFPHHQFALLAGIAQLMSSLGAMFGQIPLAKLIEVVGWRNASFILGALGFCLAALVALIIRDYPVPPSKIAPRRPLFEEWQRLAAVCRRPHTWLIGIYAFTIWTPIAVFAALWGVPYLQAKYQISIITASGLCSMIWLGIGIGSPLLGWLSDQFETRRLALALSAALGFVAVILLLYCSLPLSWMYGVLLLLGLGAGGQTVSFAVVKDYNPPKWVGTASGFNNLSVLLGGAIFQPLVGILLNHGQTTVVNNITLYDMSTYNRALLVMPCCYFISFVVAFFLRGKRGNELKAK
ncbi:MAG: MFS transporter [Legionella sp.]|nr:MFS transporter [Legionella sp.]